MTNATLPLHSKARIDSSRPVSYRHAVKVNMLTFITHDGPIATLVVKALDDPDEVHDDAIEPWRNTLTISSALSAASRPLFVLSGCDRSSA